MGWAWLCNLPVCSGGEDGGDAAAAATGGGGRDEVDDVFAVELRSQVAEWDRWGRRRGVVDRRRRRRRSFLFCGGV